MLIKQHNLTNPWGELNQLAREFDQLFSTPTKAPAEDYPKVNIWADKNSSVLTAELPGIDPKKLEITCKENTITIKGQRQLPEIAKGQRYLRNERSQGSFQRSFALPFKVDENKISAEYSNGILSVSLPQKEKRQPKKIQISITQGAA
jgi:HSP20 family protein